MDFDRVCRNLGMACCEIENNETHARVMEAPAPKPKISNVMRPEFLKNQKAQPVVGKPDNYGSSTPQSLNGTLSAGLWSSDPQAPSSRASSSYQQFAQPAAPPSLGSQAPNRISPSYQQFSPTPSQSRSPPPSQPSSGISTYRPFSPATKQHPTATSPQHFSLTSAHQQLSPSEPPQYTSLLPQHSTAIAPQQQPAMASGRNEPPEEEIHPLTGMSLGPGVVSPRLKAEGLRAMAVQAFNDEQMSAHNSNRMSGQSWQSVGSLGPDPNVTRRLAHYYWDPQDQRDAEAEPLSSQHLSPRGQLI